MLSFLEVSHEMQDELVEFLTKERWPFHGDENPTEESIRERFLKGVYTERGSKTFWITLDDKKIGLIRLFDLEDPTCLFDLRLKEANRGHGLGAEAVNWLTNYVFTNYPEITRIEGHTRQDNYAMRKTFYHCGYVKEAYHRKAWPQNGREYDSVGYAIIKDDWKNGTTTPIEDRFEY
ncbi:N-acetyltransferase [Anaerobacillus alkaliphilus]|uniref:N-acetyltransferase n=1 Tax=Anaerobacillus alkaliphilus TaxID=1548597 RepID=A0A4Q0VXI8_9BACI|nr:GNAT family protein [Anaerobacillus alkaliphilus]RXJ04249.1 N-acetyltransferase [Anaerobacillus alkaliphilus]